MDQAETLRRFVSEKSMVAKADTSARVIAVTSGKGGVGKTNFAVNLALTLRKAGSRVLVLDADFGLANIEIVMGAAPKFTLAHVLSGERAIDEIIATGPMGVGFISCGTGLQELTSINDRQMGFLINNFTYLDKCADIIIIDTGAGISKSVLNFVRAAGEAVVVTTPEPTSMMDAYSLIKALKETGGLPELRLVINKADSAAEGDEAAKRLQSVAGKFLGVSMEYLGHIPYDPLLVRAVKRQQAVMVSAPSSPFARSVERVGLTLMGGGRVTSKNGGLFTFVRKLVGIK